MNETCVENRETSRTQLWSSGGGTQSAAIAALIIQGRLPKPDLAVIVDTEREKAATWRYHDEVIVPALAAVGVELVRVPKSQFATVDLYGGEDDETLLIPAFTNASGKVGKLPTFCSNEWKARVVMRWARAQGVQECDCWIGFSSDELDRVRASRTKWFQYRYVLTELRPAFNRSNCVGVVRQMGWPDPPRSACRNCPQMGDAEWAEMQRSDPADFAEAAELDRQLRVIDPNVFLHRSCKPLAEVEFASTEQPSLFDATACGSGMCWV